MNQRKCRMFSVLNEEQPASWPHLPLRPLLAVRLAWDVSIKIAERNCLETLPYINRSVLKKRAACIGTMQNEGDWAQPNKHFATQKVFLYRRKHCLQMQTLYIRLPCLRALWNLSTYFPKFENHFAIKTVHFQVSLDAGDYFFAQEVFEFAIAASRASRYHLASFEPDFLQIQLQNTCWASPKPDV